MKTYLVMYKNGRSQKIYGDVKLFSPVNLELPKMDNANYINVDEVVSILEVNPNEKETK